MSSSSIMRNIDRLNDKDFKEFYQELKEIGKWSPEELLDELTDIFKDIEKDDLIELINTSKDIADVVSYNVGESFVYEEDSAAKKSFKELIGELYPSLSFYPALGIWGIVDKMIQSGEGFSALTPEQARLLPAYLAIFFGLVGGKIAYNRLKEHIKSKKSSRSISYNGQLSMA